MVATSSVSVVVAVAVDASTGLPLWSFPLGAAPASGMSIVGQDLFLGAGTSFESLNGETMPPQLDGIWCFSDSTS